MEDWFDMRVDPAQIAKERAKARELRRTNWWQAQIQKGVCHYCGGKFPPSELTMDHIVPLSRGGHSTKGNIVPCCKACNNNKKYTMPVDEILAELDRDGATSGFELPDIPAPEVDVEIDIPGDPAQGRADEESGVPDDSETED